MHLISTPGDGDGQRRPATAKKSISHRAGFAEVGLEVAQHALERGLVRLVLPDAHDAAALAEGREQLILQLQQRRQHTVPVRARHRLGGRAAPQLQIIAACQRAVPVQCMGTSYLSGLNSSSGPQMLP